LKIENEVVKELTDKCKVLWAINHAVSLLSWDTETYMPREGVEERSIAVSELMALAHRILVSDELSKLVEKASSIEGLNDFERGIVRVVEREVRIAKAIPEELVRELAKVSEKARVVWREAKQKDKFELFKPYLERIVDLTRQKADYLGYDENPYDALLDLYEEGLKTRDVKEVFDYIGPEIKGILNRVLAEGYYPRKHDLENVKYDLNAMERVNKRLLEIFDFPKSRARLDVSAHPFTINMGISDVRITTRYEGYDFKRSLLSVIHEFGHALYELQIDESLKATPVAHGVSYGIHESQSRFWENIIGRSREFVEAFYPEMSKELEFLKSYSSEDVYRYFNTVRPSLIRTEADEVTYNLHILLRFNIEIQLINREIKVSDAPEIWNEMMNKYLGIRPKTYRDGILQDIHWSLGDIGYFPTYTLGTIIAAQIKYHIVKEIRDFKEKIMNLDFKEIKEYLREKIHKWGSIYQPKELLQRSFGETIEPEYFIKYLKEKYLAG